MTGYDVLANVSVQAESDVRMGGPLYDGKGTSYFWCCTVIVIEGPPSPSFFEIYATSCHVGGGVPVTKGDTSTTVHAVVQCGVLLVAVIPPGAC
jgi:hypothetical protein